ncbi:methyltransferase domain-containing protein [Acidithiobacillus caldus]|nr:class I SAM-dependent methyltransferase [Acidithiobacillus caldus]
MPTATMLPEVAQVLRQSSIDQEHVVLPPNLDRDLYLKVNKVLTLYGAKWNRRRQAHVLPNAEAYRELSTAIEVGAVERKQTIQQEIGFFQTPEILAERLCTALPSIFGIDILEPSAGHGRIAQAALNLGAGTVTCVEQYAPNAAHLRQRFAHRGDEVSVIEADFLSLQPEDLSTFDAVLANPPFQKGADIRHITHAMRFVRPGGTVVAIMSAGVQHNHNRAATDFREMVRARGGHWEALPEGSFKESGTSVSTIMVTIPIN